MAIDRVTDVQALINQQVEIGEQLEVCLYKAEALTETTLMDDFCLLPKQKIQFYFWLLQDVLQKAIELNDTALKKLLRMN